MAVSVSYPEWWDDQEFYPLHEEDDGPEIPPHEATARYLRDGVAARFPEWFVTGDVCIYWEPGNTQAYRAPDLLVVKEPLAEEVHRVYQTWKQPPVALVAEIGNDPLRGYPAFRIDEGPKVEIYQDRVRAAEYFYADPPQGDQRLWRLGPNGYEAVAPEANGRLRSAELGLEFGLDAAGHLWLYTPEGERLRTHTESEEERQAAEGRAAAEARRRQEAEAQRAEEARRRQEAEARVVELERQLAEWQTQRGEG
jgi:Uma2 family endonuclease